MFKQEPSGDTQTLKFRVWSLDVWGHGSDECCAAYSCPCIVQDEDDEPVHDTDHRECDGGFTVNDRCEVGEIEIEVAGVCYNAGTPYAFIRYSPSNPEILAALKENNFLKDEVTIDQIDVDGSDEHTFYIESSSSNGRPLFQLELTNG